MFSDFGAGAFAERPRHELVAAAQTIAGRTTETRDVLTPQETQVARLAAQGRTNPKIGSQLFSSSCTVEYHLRKVFTKLAAISRSLAAETNPFVPQTKEPALPLPSTRGRSGRYARSIQQEARACM
jgi:DNA-binding CsgD family transcriptional regulator